MPQQEQDANLLYTDEYTFVLNTSGLVFWLKPLDSDTRPDLDPELIQHLVPRDALALARLIISNESVLVQRQKEIDELYTRLAGLILSEMEINTQGYRRETAQQFAERRADWSEVAYAAEYASIALHNADVPTELDAWSEESYKNGPYTHVQQHNILLAYVKAAYFQKYPYSLS